MLRRIIIISISAFCLIAMVICIAVSSSLRSALRSQQAATAWSGQSGERFSQISVFFRETLGFDEDSIGNLRRSLDEALLRASLEDTDGRNLYTDAWSAEVDVTLISQRTTNPTQAKAIAVGGDFFMFHPIRLRDGNYLSPSDIMHDRVVLDEELAWRLFGAIHVTGFELMLNDRPFKVAGVIARENDFASSKAYTYGAGLFMSFEMLLEMTEGDARVSTYEIVLPDPVTGFALNTLTEAMQGQDFYAVENSTRYSLGKIFSLVGSFGERSMRQNPITFPYWENAARYTEDFLALLLVLTLFFMTFPLVCAIIYLVILIRYGLNRGKQVVKHVIDQHDKREYEKYVLQHGEDGEAYNYDADSIIREYQDEIF